MPQKRGKIGLCLKQFYFLRRISTQSIIMAARIAIPKANTYVSVGGTGVGSIGGIVAGAPTADRKVVAYEPP
ncbi:MAG: hypothetical protein AC479_01695 [miscellaneous Crenarchaeota group-6 archaeon AD8-1]|nr:MAG: hypothetical protein AC479_01695 [miscellaneous Crenarchaeota group-6 archaeon AD8-1]